MSDELNKYSSIARFALYKKGVLRFISILLNVTLSTKTLHVTTQILANFSNFEIFFVTQ